MSKKHRGVIQKQFTKTLDAFSKFAVRDSAETVAERVAYAKAQPEDLVLDVACGPGTFVLAFATLVKFARGIDVTPAMLVRARQYQRERVAQSFVVKTLRYLLLSMATNKEGRRVLTTKLCATGYAPEPQ